MKRVAVALLLVNMAVGAYFVWTQNQSNTLAGVYFPINAEKIILQSTRLANSETHSAQRAEAPVSGDPICVEWRGLGEADLGRARDAVKALAAQRVLSVEELPVDKMFWIIFPPLPSEAAGEVKLREITALKVKDAFVIKDGVWKHGISFGLYSSEDSARRYMRELEEKGVSGLRLETKPKQGTAFYYLVKSEDAATLKDLDDIRQTLPATTLTRVACRK